MVARTFKLAWFKRNRYVLTVVAIALSVAFIVSTLLLTTSIADVGQPIEDAYVEVDAVIVGPQVVASDGPVAGVTMPVPAAAVDALVAEGYQAVGFSDPYAQVIAADGNPAGQDQASANVAEPWLGSSPLNAFEIVEGAAPAATGEAALDLTTADGAGLAIGDSFTYVTNAGLAEAELVGIASFGGADNEPYVSSLLLDPADEIFEVSQGYNRVLVAAGSTGDGAGDGIGAVLETVFPAYEIQTTQAWTAEQIGEINDQLSFFETFLTVFAVIAVVVGMVIVANTFTVSLAQRTQELALLRLVGTTRRQLMTQVVLEAILLGLVGTVAGVALGIGGVEVLGALLDFLGLAIERSDALSMTAIGIGVAVGIGVTVVAAVRPARKATAVAPIEALRSAELDPPSAGRRKGAAALILAVGAVGALAYGMTEGDILWAGVGIGATFVALYLGAGHLVGLTARAARPVLGAAGPTGIVASRNLERNAGRTSAAANALMIGIGLVAFFTLMAATVGQLMNGDSASGLRTDHVVQGIDVFAEPVLGDETLTRLAETDGVDEVVAIRQTAVRPLVEIQVEQPGPGGDTMAVATAQLDGLRQAYDFDVVSGSLDDVAGTAVIFDEATAEAFAVAVGDTVPFQSQSGPVEFQVAAIVADSLPGTPQPGIIGDADLTPILGYDGPAIAAYVLGSADEAALTAAIDLPTLDVLTTEDYVDRLSAGLDTILSLVYALLAVAVVIALVGIANTVSLAISERVGEIAAVRAAGGSSRQIFRSLLAEFGLLALVGVVAGLGLAWVSAAALFQALSDGAVTYPETDLVSGVAIVAAGLVGAVLAAWWPARSAARADLLEVLRAD